MVFFCARQKIPEIFAVIFAQRKILQIYAQIFADKYAVQKNRKYLPHCSKFGQKYHKCLTVQIAQILAEIYVVQKIPEKRKTNYGYLLAISRALQ